ncbi:SDR family oxidoreductase [Camelliibacillus cellulosilyticus]|uniref:SDR family oxidoreductase n=1 Tax=Camelliibacillus cellulosilyticus TaxID=2174486 RepID=A0ABV9GJM5_9BACL
MKILILGGTVFLGRHIVNAALKRGHEVTLFNRGNHPELFPDVEKLQGDRDGNLEPLENKTWDAVIDTSGYFPRVVRQSTELLADRVEHYTFISSISVYDDFSQADIDESAPVGRLWDETIEEVNDTTYGPLKALCEQEVVRAMPGRSLVIRPGLIVGPYDVSDRFTYWPYRMSQGGKVLAPGDPNRPIQFIDVRDLAEWTIGMVELKKTGVYNAAGPDHLLTMKGFLDGCQKVCRNQASVIWLEEDFLKRHDVGYWIELPLWIPESENMSGMLKVNIGKARSEGLTFRTLEETVQDTLAWCMNRSDDIVWRAGLDSLKEQQLLQQWVKLR